MIIDFEAMPELVIKNFRGGQNETIARMFTDDNGKIMYGCLKPGASIGFHTHETSSEIIYFLIGQGKMLYDEGTEEIKAGMCHYCPKGHSHSLMNDSSEDLVFFAVVPEQ